jgi:hypothetical protein
MRIRHHIRFIRRQMRDQHAQQVLVPLVVVVNSLVDLRYNRLQLLVGERIHIKYSLEKQCSGSHLENS